MVYTVFYKTSSFAGYCFLDKNSIHPKRYGVFSFKTFKAVLVKIQICSFIVSKFPEEIEIRTAHVFYDHKKAASKAVEYLMCSDKIGNGEQLKKEFNDLAALARMARNMALKYNFIKDNKIIDKLIGIYKDMKQLDKECFEKLYNAI